MENLETYDIIKKSRVILILLEIEIETSQLKLKKLIELKELVLEEDKKNERKKQSKKNHK